MKALKFLPLIALSFGVAQARVPDTDETVIHAAISVAERVCAQNPKGNVWLPLDGKWIPIPCAAIKSKKAPYVVDFFDELALKDAYLDSALKFIGKLEADKK